jgi:hypothetical protein
MLRERDSTVTPDLEIFGLTSFDDWPQFIDDEFTGDAERKPQHQLAFLNTAASPLSTKETAQ